MSGWACPARYVPGNTGGAPVDDAPTQLVKKGFDKLVDGEASSPARCRASNLRFEPSAVSPKAKPENPKGFQPLCHPHQSPLKIEDFSGAEPARKRFLLWKMGFSGAKIAPCPRCAFALPILWRGGSKWSRALPGRKGCGPLELSRGFDKLNVPFFPVRIVLRLR